MFILCEGSCFLMHSSMHTKMYKHSVASTYLKMPYIIFNDLYLMIVLLCEKIIQRSIPDLLSWMHCLWKQICQACVLGNAVKTKLQKYEKSINVLFIKKNPNLILAKRSKNRPHWKTSYDRRITLIQYAIFHHHFMFSLLTFLHFFTQTLREGWGPAWAFKPFHGVAVIVCTMQRNRVLFVYFLLS